jgi:ABC-type transport system involved in Fe-S cluster assembly fused permease/ATPase subunit
MVLLRPCTANLTHVAERYHLRRGGGGLVRCQQVRTSARLLYRFYDDAERPSPSVGQDIKQVTQSSVRSAVGIVLGHRAVQHYNVIPRQTGG